MNVNRDYESCSAELEALSVLACKPGETYVVSIGDIHNGYVFTFKVKEGFLYFRYYNDMGDEDDQAYENFKALSREEFFLLYHDKCTEVQEVKIPLSYLPYSVIAKAETAADIKVGMLYDVVSDFYTLAMELETYVDPEYFHPDLALVYKDAPVEVTDI